MRYGLGVDTGGTFTDAVIADLDEKRILAKAKAPTTYGDLGIGILEAVDKVFATGACAPGDISLTGLSTTLATNSILQGKGGMVGLIGMGWRPDPDWDLGTTAELSRFVDGQFDSVGKTLVPLDEAGCIKAIEELVPHVDAMVVSGLFSVNNPLQERRAMQLIAERTGLPIVAGHMIAGELGIKERTVTAVLNAKLIRIIDSFLKAVEGALRARGVKSRILVFKGDGGLMTLETARERPIETILCGPAASLMGGKFLSKLDDCIVIDVGGTSTDIATLSAGFPRTNRDGAVVGSWKTRVKALDMWTCGLGGDSFVTLSRKGEMTIGPERALPFAVAGMRHPNVKDLIEKDVEPLIYAPTGYSGSRLTKKEQAILDYLAKKGPASFLQIMNDVPEVVRTMDTLTALRAKGCVIQIGPTPTDAMILMDLYDGGDKETAKAGLFYLAERFEVDLPVLAKIILDQFITRVSEELVKMAVSHAVAGPMTDQAFRDLLRLTITDRSPGGMRLRAGFDRAVIGIGAPAPMLVKPLSERITSEVIIPDGYDVGNAVGAVCSMMTESYTVQVYAGEDRYYVLAPGTVPTSYMHVEEAVSAAKRTAEYYVRKRLEEARTKDIQIRVEREEQKFCDGYGREMKFINWVEIRAIGIGTPEV